MDIIKALRVKPELLTLGAATEGQINDAEIKLGLSFSEDYKEYLTAFGAASYDGHELTGICKSARLNVVNVTLEERELNPDIPSDWYVVEQLNIDNVSIWQSGSGEIYQVMPGKEPIKIFDSLAEYVRSDH